MVPSPATRKRFPWRPVSSATSRDPLAAPLEGERHHPVAGERLEGGEPGALQLAPEQRLEREGRVGLAGAAGGGVEAGDVRLGGDEEEDLAGATPERQRERSLGVDPHRLDVRAGQRRELRDHGGNLSSGERHCPTS